MREIRRPLALLATAVALAVPLVACGGDDDDDSGEETAAATTEASETTAPKPGGKTRTISVSETDFALAPKDLKVKAGTTVTFEVLNAGATDHNLEVEGPEGEAELEQDLAPGERGTLQVSFSKPGTYEWYCPVGDHREQGMEGTITVN
jgi:plastocyanin